jgi:hypothetical protein
MSEIARVLVDAMEQCSKLCEMDRWADVQELIGADDVKGIEAKIAAIRQADVPPRLEVWDGPLLLKLDAIFVQVYVVDKKVSPYFAANVPESRVLWAQYYGQVMKLIREEESSSASFPPGFGARAALMYYWSPQDEDCRVPVLSVSVVKAIADVFESIQSAVSEVCY